MIYMCEMTKGQEMFMGVCIAVALVALLIVIIDIIDELRK